MLIPMNKTRQWESSHGNTGRQGLLSRSDSQMHYAGRELAPSEDTAAVARRRRLKRCQQTHGRRVSASGSGQEPCAPRANSIANKVAAPSVR
jgi:hypothetical protein